MQNREVVDVFCLHRQLPGLAQHQQVRLPAVTQEQDSSSGGRLVVSTSITARLVILLQI